LIATHIERIAAGVDRGAAGLQTLDECLTAVVAEGAELGVAGERSCWQRHAETADEVALQERRQKEKARFNCPEMNLTDPPPILNE
jgi:hypothetical protein